MDGYQLGTGPGITDGWNDSLIASTDATLGNGDDVLLATFAHLGLLGVDDNYTQTETFRLPPALQGHFHLFVRTDADNVVFENDLEANNAAELEHFFDVIRIPYADLTPTESTAPATGGSGQPISVSWQVVNQGIGITNSAQWTDTVSLVRNADGSGHIATLGQFIHNGVLDTGGSYARTADVIIPNGVTGTTYIKFETDSRNGVFEFLLNGNNSLVSDAIELTLSDPPDLLVTEIVAPDQAVLSGSKIDVSWTVKNDGTGLAAGSWGDRVVLREQVAGGQTIELGRFTYTDPLEPGQSYQRSEQFRLPSRLEGLFRIEVTTNYTNSLYEHTNTDNNTALDVAVLQINQAPRPDLQVLEVITPDSASAGGITELEFVVTNLGAVATRTPTWTDRVYLSLDNQISSDDTLVFSAPNGAALDSVESYRTRSESIAIPRFFRGDVFLIVQTDAASQVDEYPRDDNNTVAVPINIIPLPPSDLVTSDIVAPSEAYDGTEIEVRYKVTNHGLGETDRDSWTDTIWLARDATRPARYARWHRARLLVRATYESGASRISAPSRLARAMNARSACGYRLKCRASTSLLRGRTPTT